MERPESVSRVAPPTMIIAKISPATQNSQTRTAVIDGAPWRARSLS
jgi:hypothetical protein